MKKIDLPSGTYAIRTDYVQTKKSNTRKRKVVKTYAHRSDGSTTNYSKTVNVYITNNYPSRNVRNRVRRKRSNRVSLPKDGQYRAFPEYKSFVLSDKKGKKYSFTFMIDIDVVDRRFDDGNRWESKTFIIYIMDIPYYQWALNNNTEYGIHIYNIAGETPTICWNKPIRSHQDANAIMFVWAKRYVSILYAAERDISPREIRTRIALPGGSYRNDDEKVIYFTKEVFNKIKNIIGKRKPELGGILGSSNNPNIIDRFVFDKNANVGETIYTPNTKFLEHIINDVWYPQDVEVAGIIHSHPHGGNIPSDDDYDYSLRVLNSLDNDFFIMPIVNSDYDNKFRITPYKLYRDGTMVKCSYKIVNAIKNNDIEALLDNEDEILKVFEEMNKNTDNVFARNDRTINEEFLSSCTIIGIGCGGARDLYLSLARCGISNFILMDGDKVDVSNVGSQGAYLSEVGQYKVDAIKNRILDINSNANVKAINLFLNDDLDDNYIEKELLAGIKGPVVICGMCDSFLAQARVNNIAIKYGIPLVVAQHHQFGDTGEVIFYYPGVTPNNPIDILSDRYEYYELGNVNTVTSQDGLKIFTDKLNEVSGKIIYGLLVYDKYGQTRVSSFVEKCKDRNLIIIKECDLSFTNSPFQSLFSEKEKNEVFDEMAWIDVFNDDVYDSPLKHYYFDPEMDTRSIFNAEKQSDELIEFIKANEALREKSIAIYNEKKHQEVVDERSAYYCYLLVKKMEIVNNRDLFVYCAATNLLSAFIKQAKIRGEFEYFDYKYKEFALDKIIKTYNDDFPDVRYFATIDSGNSILYICLGPTIFSYHGVKKNKLYYTIREESEGINPFDGVRKQLCALSSLKIGEQIAHNGGKGYLAFLEEAHKEMELYDLAIDKKELLLETID